MADRPVEDPDDEQAVAALAEAIRPTLSTHRFRLDQGAVEDVIRIVRATLKASAADPGRGLHPHLL